ncbi:MAG: carbohydrate-binding family V/XII [Chlorobi bacterium]|nr:carbohydrate-binding family V/XII [Chlorobiota bacterium]
MKKFILFGFFFLITFYSALFAEDEPGLQWPKEIKKNGTVVVLYQPQLESFKGNVLQGRMALSVTPKDEEILFGALWFKAYLETDFDERTALLKKLDITKIHFPNFTDTARIEKFTRLLTEEVESWNLLMSLDRILAGLEETENLKTYTEKLNNNPPDIYFRTKPAVLITIDGDPIIKEVQGQKFEYVVNTPFFIVEKKNKYYIKGGKFWYVSSEVISGYAETEKVPSDIKKFAEENLPETEQDSITEKMDKAPELIVVTKPSELISTEGKPEYSAINDTKLLYVSNTSDDIVMDISTQELYILLAGRWFKSKSLEDGSWTFVEPADLPDDFSKIPDDSDMAEVRASVPGTPEAEEALLEQAIPQTATVDRKTTTVEVKWDGNPKFEKIKDTDVSVAKNSNKTVLLIKSKYYCVDDGIWFVANSPDGPWAVSDVRPDEVDKIPPESEAYNVKYVYIYESTPEVVYVGYLPGYTWSFGYHGCVVYGTGYWYRPWYHHYYYPRPVTWGFGVHWNPYTGWGFSFGIGFGWVGWGFHPYGGWWGPRGFYPGYRHGYYHGYRHGYYHGYRRGAAAGYYAGRRQAYNNVYRHRTTGVKTGVPARTPRNLNSKARPSTRPNNVYTDRKGNVYQRDKSGNWQQKNNNRTRPATQPSQRPSTKPAQKPSQRPVTTKPAQKPAQRPSTRPVTQPSTKPTTRPATKPATQPSTRPSTQPKTKPTTRPTTGQTRQQPAMSTQQRQQLNRAYQSRSRGNTSYNRARSYGGARGGYRGGGGGRRR